MVELAQKLVELLWYIDLTVLDLGLVVLIICSHKEVCVCTMMPLRVWPKGANMTTCHLFIMFSNRIESQTYNWELPIASNSKVVLKMPMLFSLFGFL
jgi:hypothetical protein